MKDHIFNQEMILNRKLYKKDLNSDDILNIKKPMNEINNILKIIENIAGEDTKKIVQSYYVVMDHDLKITIKI